MEIKVFFGEKAVHLCNEKDATIEALMHHPHTIFIDELSNHAINTLLHEIKKETFHAGIIIHEDLEKLKKLFFHHFTSIEAAGGIVQNEKNEILFIFRRGKWDLPKGKMEVGETSELCAEREIEEETGIKNMLLKKKIGNTYHVYDEFGKHYLKTTHWFHFTCSSNQQLQAQTEEDITAVTWVPTKNISQPMENSYASIRDIMSLFIDATDN